MVTRHPQRPQAPAWSLATCSYTEWRPTMGTLARTSLERPKMSPARNERDRFVWEVSPRPQYRNSDKFEYEQAYLDQLDRFGAKQITNRFREIAIEVGGGRLVLCCFEVQSKGRDNWCHRTMFRQWWLETVGEDIPELGAPPPAWAQDSLL